MINTNKEDQSSSSFKFLAQDLIQLHQLRIIQILKKISILLLTQAFALLQVSFMIKMKYVAFYMELKMK
jgi:hypothetical protein